MPTPYVPEIEHWPEAFHDARPVLLLMAYECMPDAEAEAYAGWERVLQAAREFDVHVIVGARSFAAIEERGHTHEIPGVHFHTPKEDALYRLLKRAPNLFPHNDIAYYHWQRLAYRKARELHRKHCFSLVHQINARTFREPGYTWRLGIPYVWGPMGGAQNLPVAFLAGLPLAEQIKERAHNIGNRLSLRRPRVKRAAKHASVLLAVNSANKSDFERAFRRRVELLPETAIDAVRRPETAKFRARGPLNILWSGESARSKALPLLLEALANLGHDVEYQLHILGDGPIDMEREALATQLGVVRRCTFFGDRRTELSPRTARMGPLIRLHQPARDLGNHGPRSARPWRSRDVPGPPGRGRYRHTGVRHQDPGHPSRPCDCRDGKLDPLALSGPQPPAPALCGRMRSRAQLPLVRKRSAHHLHLPQPRALRRAEPRNLVARARNS